MAVPLLGSIAMALPGGIDRLELRFLFLMFCAAIVGFRVLVTWERLERRSVDRASKTTRDGKPE